MQHDVARFACAGNDKNPSLVVSVKTGNGPDSHIGDFATEAEAKDWILTKSKYWPSKPDTAK
jgi:hypothetical protein